jgi:iron complex transport system substrate-binding protein
MRVVSLLPSATEMLYALGVEPVGVSHECDHPPEAAARPSMNVSRVDPDGDSETITEQVAEAEAEHGGVYDIKRDALLDADPDLVVTQGVCDVCAVDQVQVRRVVEEEAVDAEVLTLDTHGVEDLFDAVQRIGDAVGRRREAADLVSGFRERVEQVERRAAEAAGSPRVVLLDWMDPPMVAGHWVPEMVERLGAAYDLQAAGGHSRPREWETITEYDPEVLVAAPCGFPLERTVEHAGELTGRDGWADIAAVEAGQAYLLEGHHLVNRPGPRLVDSFEYLAALVYPDRFDAPPTDVARPLEDVEVEA